MMRNELPNARAGMIIDLALKEPGDSGIVHRFSVMIGPVGDDGSPLEVFVSGRKAGSSVSDAARDAGILISFARQYGVPLEELRGAVTRGDHGEPASIIGAVLDAMAEA